VIGLSGQAPRRAIRKIADVDVAESLVEHLVAARRDLDPAQHLHVEVRRRDFDREAHRLFHAPRRLHVKRDHRDLFRRQIDAANHSAGPEDDPLVVGRPGKRRIDAVDRPGLLHVAIEPVVQRPLAARLEVAHEERRLVADAPHERERLAVRRRRRADRAARAGDVALDVAALAVEPLDDVQLFVRILAVLEDRAGRDVVAEVDVLAVRREHRLAAVFLIGALLGHLQTVAAAAVIDPHLARAEGALGGEMLARDDVLAVGTPIGRIDEAEGLLGDLLRIGAVPLHVPDVVAAGAVGGERDPLAVRRVARLHVPGDAAGERLRLAAADRNGVEVAEEIEHDLFPIRADVDAHPRPRGYIDRHVMRGTGRIVDVPLLVFLLVLLLGLRLGCGCGRKRRRRVFLLRLFLLQLLLDRPRLLLRLLRLLRIGLLVAGWCRCRRGRRRLRDRDRHPADDEEREKLFHGRAPYRHRAAIAKCVVALNAHQRIGIGRRNHREREPSAIVARAVGSGAMAKSSWRWERSG
jgi:hypothetical protein